MFCKFNSDKQQLTKTRIYDYPRQNYGYFLYGR